MSQPGQMELALADQPKERRESVLVAFHNSGGLPIPAAEIKARDRKASAQEQAVLTVFRELDAYGSGARLTPSHVNSLIRGALLTSTRRAMTNLTTRGLLVHHKRERKPGPFGVGESTWSLNPEGQR